MNEQEGSFCTRCGALCAGCIFCGSCGQKNRLPDPLTVRGSALSSLDKPQPSRSHENLAELFEREFEACSSPGRSECSAEQREDEGEGASLSVGRKRLVKRHSGGMHVPSVPSSQRLEPGFTEPNIVGGHVNQRKTSNNTHQDAADIRGHGRMLYDRRFASSAPSDLLLHTALTASKRERASSGSNTLDQRQPSPVGKRTESGSLIAAVSSVDSPQSSKDLQGSVRPSIDISEQPSKISQTMEPRSAGADVDESRLSGTGRVLLNVGGKRFETCTETLTRWPETLLGTMFLSRNEHLRRPDSSGEYFFDRCPRCFEVILNFYRTGYVIRSPFVTFEMLEPELDFWQIPCATELGDEDKVGAKAANVALATLRKKVDLRLTKIKQFVIALVHSYALAGVQRFSVEFRESEEQEFYSFLSVFAHRELLLHDLLQQNLAASFADLRAGTVAFGHRYVLQITLWSSSHTPHLYTA